MTPPRSLRWRLTLVFSGLSALVVLAAATETALLIEQAVWAPLDAAIEEEAETLVTIRDVGRAEELAQAVVAVGSERDLGARKFVRVTDPYGQVLAQSGGIPAEVVAAPPPSMPKTKFRTLWQGLDPYRLVWSPAPGGGWSEVGVRVSKQVRTLHRIRFATAVAAGAVLTMLGALAWTITTRATTELERLAGELETIEAGSLDRRLAPRQTTEVARLASVLNRLLGRLETALGQLRRFTADAAHELRTPIAALRAHLEVAVGSARSFEALRNRLLDALEQTERLGRLAESLLTLSAVEAGNPVVATEGVRLDELVREVAESLEPIAEDQGRVFRCRIEDAVSVNGAPDLLKRMVLNLLDNALRHTPPPSPINLSVWAKNGTATIEVNDGGLGIEAADLPLIFDRFRRGRSASAGTGLGLALCREIVTRHGGEITVQSIRGTGTTVRVTLPLRHEAASGELHGFDASEEQG